MKPALALAAALLCAPAAAQALQLAGVLGGKALLVDAGSAPRAVAVGESFAGARVLAVGRDEVLIELGGMQQRLRLGEAPVSIGARSAPGRSLVLHADAGGHFTEEGSINGRPVRFMVDTGATTVALGRAEAERLGIRVQAGERVRMHTANGTAEGWRVRLDSVRIGPLQQSGVVAIVVQQPMPYVLLGNSFLQPYEMARKGSELTLHQR
ncbi:TIGR02281 family clan AA aspartic protease [Comamonas sp. NLF-1-9]|uniref:retropepsin-like aspartic protease family protein n=1 Tax=Comamonas sp. NLF-1-9 TaxID=2853163 RepID=UPI001C490C08|nr:retropepsin-like aspartic protease [Comamonas sp. NLF-1-9]QXL84926.1 retroviral-like aspartic protease family protein [Comamonas sp. NLF-1-9]